MSKRKPTSKTYSRSLTTRIRTGDITIEEAKKMAPYASMKTKHLWQQAHEARQTYVTIKKKAQERKPFFSRVWHRILQRSA